MPSKGRFVWYDLMTKDVDAAIAFFTEVVGWRTEPFTGGDKPYTMWKVGDQSVGGVMLLPPEAEGAPPHWLGYVAVDDVDATSAQAEKLGGAKHHVMDIPDVGRFAVLADPQGAFFAVFKAAGDMPMHEGEPRPGDFSWHELNTGDWEAAWKFYSQLFSWKATESMDMGGELGTYFMFQRADADGSMGGMSNAATMMGAPPHWLYYITVDDIDAAVTRIKNGGGQILNGPMDVPGGDKIAQCMDPQGGAFAIHWRNK